MKLGIPVGLTTLRLLLGPVTLFCAIHGAPRIVYLPILVIGTLSDIFDGILARRFRVSTPFLRRYDSVTDIIYYLFVLSAVWMLCRPVFVKTRWAILLLLLSEAGCIGICAARFGKYPATHSYLSKFYGLCLLGGLIALLVFDASGWVIFTLMVVGLVTNIEIIVMHCISDFPPVDLPSIFVLRNVKQP